MSNDFEVHPIGTAEELKLSRQLSAAIAQITHQYGDGIVPESVLEFAVSTNTVSCPRKGTSYQRFPVPLLSIIESIPIIFTSSNVIVLNFSTLVMVSVAVFTSPEYAFTVFISLN